MVLRQFRSSLLAGLLFLVTLALTVWIVYNVFFWLDGFLNESVSRLIFKVFFPGRVSGSIPGVGVPALLLLLVITGMAVRNVVGRFVVNWSDQLFTHIPVIRHIYTTLQQIGYAFLSDRSETFKRAVLFEYPRSGVFSIGFVTQDTRGPVQRAIAGYVQSDCYSIFLPTTPNPTSGFLLFVPKSQVIELNISVEEALKLIISGGAVVPSEKASAEPHAITVEQLRDVEAAIRDREH